MSATSFLTALKGIFDTPDYAARIPANVRSAISSGNYGQTTFSTNEENAVFEVLIDKISKQDMHTFVYQGIDSEKFYRGFMPYGGIIEDDFVEVPTADNQDSLPQMGTDGTLSPTFDFSKFNPYDYKLPSIKTSYYMLKVLLQYHNSVPYSLFKRAFISEAGAQQLVTMIRGGLGEAMKLDTWLILREMLQSPTNFATASQVSCNIAGDEFTQAEALDVITKIQLYAKALTMNTSKYNKLGVLNNTRKDRLRLYIAAGVKTYIEKAQVNAFNRMLDYGVEVVEIEGFGQTGLTNAVFAVLVDTSAPFFYDWKPDSMSEYFNNRGEGYFTVWRSRGLLLGFSMYRNAVLFKLTTPGA